MVRKLSLVEKVNITTQVPKSTGGGKDIGLMISQGNGMEYGSLRGQHR